MGLFDSLHDADEDVSDRFQPVESATSAGTAGSEASDDAEAAGENDRELRFASARPRDAGFSGTLKRAVDEEAGVVIYAYKSGNGAGVTAVPLSQTKLDGDSDDAVR
ncbi:hypothetical protein [Haloprofundus salinisoli]|uniref:hypothetical protein n=1 Tax=Haloprofundus salinisoli TaxID=2876193 RepID=UPI001CCCF3F5|nr:hypothetical protein [Haloprofundus salinisoli]